MYGTRAKCKANTCGDVMQLSPYIIFYIVHRTGLCSHRLAVNRHLIIGGGLGFSAKPCCVAICAELAPNYGKRSIPESRNVPGSLDYHHLWRPDTIISIVPVLCAHPIL